MRRLLLTALALLNCASFGFALRVAGPAPLPMRVAQADAVILGKVTALEAKTVKAERFQGDKDMGEYLIATVKINEAIVGGKDVTHIKVGFVPAALTPEAPEEQPGKFRPVLPGGPRGTPPSLTKGQEAILFLVPHHKENFYILRQNTDVVDVKSPEYKQIGEELKKIAKVYADPLAALKVKDAEERFRSAALLLYRYRTAKVGQTKLEALDAEESKLILQALAEANWDAPRIGGFQLHPQNVFYLVGAQAKDGWTQPRDFRQFAAAAKQWLKDNGEKFKLMRYVAGK